MHIRFDSRFPLRIWANIRLGAEGDVHWVDFKYEKLSLFYFRCGLLSHTLCECSMPANQEAEEILPFGLFLNGSSLRLNSGRGSNQTHTFRRKGEQSQLGIDGGGAGRNPTPRTICQRLIETYSISTKLPKNLQSPNSHNLPNQSLTFLTSTGKIPIDTRNISSDILEPHSIHNQSFLDLPLHEPNPLKDPTRKPIPDPVDSIKNPNQWETRPCPSHTHPHQQPLIPNSLSKFLAPKRLFHSYMADL